MQVEVQRDVAAVEAEWDELAERTRAEPWARPGWIRAWLAAFGGGTPELVAVRRDGGLAAIAPLVRRAGVLRSPTNWHSPGYHLVAEDAAARAALVEAVLERAPRRLQLAFLPTDGGGLEETRELGRAAGRRVLERVVQSSPYAALPAHWEAYEAERSRSLLKDVRRRRRRLEEQGEVTFDTHDGADGLHALLDELFAVEGSGWKLEQGTAIVSRPETRRFYTEVATWAAARGWLELAFLRLDGRPLAGELLLRVAGRTHDLKGGYDPDYRRFGPGVLLTLELVRAAIERGDETFELLGSADRYKLEWGEQLRERVLVQCFAPGAPGIADWAAHAYGRPAAKSILATVRR